ncbi:hypothetical protein [Planomicrobium okeanokoites]|uniref:Uncharacterized protein n=1 Tax=Planomicrobium okeanokoites TaxID=244 RepID=A0ABV7KT58_PLAOK|nr:hypothetical protein [Planomicrobium okeanokoites]
MTLSIFLWTAGAALIFGFTNAMAYARGFGSGWNVGYVARVEDAKLEVEENE